MKISEKQNEVKETILNEKTRRISILGSVQSGKTYIISYSVIMYAQSLYNYSPDTLYYGAIIGWTTGTLKGNVVDVIQNFLDELGYRKNIDYELKYGADEKYLKLFNLKIYFFGFNTILSFNKILGKPILFLWVDEAARIYTQAQLRESFDELSGRQASYVGHPYYRTIHSFNVEGGERHPYKIKYIDNWDATKFVFFPWDNPKIDTKEKLIEFMGIFPSGSTLQKQKIFNEWVVAEGKVFTKINILKKLDDLIIREIGIGIDYGSVNPTTYVPIALCFHKKLNKWLLVRLECYYHDATLLNDTPTTEYYSLQLRYFILYLKNRYEGIPITTIVLDSEAKHFANRLETDNIPYELSEKGAGSVNEGVEHLQALFYKEYLYIYEHVSITHLYDEKTYEMSAKDESLIEYDNYQYDSVTSIKTGVNCYKKVLDHCLTEDTIIATINGNCTIKELAGTTGKCFCYDIENKKIVISDYDNAKKTQTNVDIYELELENGYKIKGTYDHLILTTKGYKQLGTLTQSDEVLTREVI